MSFNCLSGQSSSTMRFILKLVCCAILISGCNNDKVSKKAKIAQTVSDSVGLKDQNVEKTALENLDPPNIEPEQIIEEKPFVAFTPFWTYYSTKIMLNEDFIGYDKNRSRISKAKFLKQLSTGIYQPILINPTDSIRYQLKRSPPAADTGIALYMEKFANDQLTFYSMEGKPIPKFDFTTIDDKHYTSNNTKGKIMLFKCWFLSCSPCVKEIPDLNELVETYKNRNDFVFISLAIDEKAPIKEFLKKTKFDYQTVAQQEPYMVNKLHVQGYPTHFLVDKQGLVVKVSNDVREMKMFLERLLTKN